MGPNYKRDFPAPKVGKIPNRVESTFWISNGSFLMAHSLSVASCNIMGDDDDANENRTSKLNFAFSE